MTERQPKQQSDMMPKELSTLNLWTRIYGPVYFGPGEDENNKDGLERISQLRGSGPMLT
jgi:hypothetical protein